MGLTWMEMPTRERTPEDDEYDKMMRRRYRPHCRGCGRFIPSSSLRTVKGPGMYETDDAGTCKVCGSCSVSWPE